MKVIKPKSKEIKGNIATRVSGGCGMNNRSPSCRL